MSKHAFTVIVAIIIAVSLLLYMFAFTVRQNEKAVVMTFGAPSEQLPPPGYHFKWPWPIQEVRRFDNRLHSGEGIPTEVPTRGQINVITSIYVGWKIQDVLKFNENCGRAEDPIAQGWANLDRIVRDRMLNVLAQHELRELVSATTEPDYKKIEDEIKVGATKEAADFGIEVAMVKLKRLELPEVVTMAVYERMKTERGNEAETIKAGGDQTAQNIRDNAKYQAEQIVTRARSEAESLRTEGDAEAARSYAIFAENPDLAIFLRKLRALREASRENTTLVFDTTMSPWDVMRVPEMAGDKAAAPGAR